MANGKRFRNVVLGFAEPCDERTNLPSSFASKAGGLPVWLLRPPNRPPAAPRCNVCGQTQRFLLQVYAPLEKQVVGHDNAFHRVLTLAICMNGGCARSTQCVSVLRAQLPRRNQYYAWDAEEEHDVTVEHILEDVCDVCGFLGQTKCGGCRRVTYCGKSCQASHWKNGHKQQCASSKSDHVQSVKSLQFNEVEIVTDVHPDVSLSDSDDDSDDDDDGDEECSQSTHVQHAQVRGTFQDADESELPEDLFAPRKGRTTDATYDRFCKVVSSASDQVIRYERAGRELWGGSASQCDQVPDCQSCGGRRVFEMQVMPQLLYYICERDGRDATIERLATRLRNDLDWTTICVYCCENSCGRGGEYVREFAWVQPATSG